MLFTSESGLVLLRPNWGFATATNKDAKDLTHKNGMLNSMIGVLTVAIMSWVGVRRESRGVSLE